MKKLPQLTLRDLFWLVALVAMGCGWWVDRQMQEERIRQLELPTFQLQEVIRSGPTYIPSP